MSALQFQLHCDSFSHSHLKAKRFHHCNWGFFPRWCEFAFFMCVCLCVCVQHHYHLYTLYVSGSNGIGIAVGHDFGKGFKKTKTTIKCPNNTGFFCLIPFISCVCLTVKFTEIVTSPCIASYST